MSKYILVVDLPDDDKCRGCPLLNEVQDWCFAMEAHIDLIEWGNPMNWIRNLDCPLIPVDRVMERIRSMQGERKASGLDHWNDALDEAVDILRDELEVTE